MRSKAPASTSGLSSLGTSTTTSPPRSPASERDELLDPRAHGSGAGASAIPPASARERSSSSSSRRASSSVFFSRPRGAPPSGRRRAAAPRPASVFAISWIAAAGARSSCEASVTNSLSPPGLDPAHGSFFNLDGHAPRLAYRQRRWSCATCPRWTSSSAGATIRKPSRPRGRCSTARATRSGPATIPATWPRASRRSSPRPGGRRCAAC